MAKNRQDRTNWLEGPQIAGERDTDQPSRWPGETLGLAQYGAGSQASILRRVGGVILDWFISLALSGILFFIVKPSSTANNGGQTLYGDFTSTWALIIYVVIGIVSVWLFARTPGQFLLRMGVARVDDPSARVGLWRAAVRTLLTIFLLPAAICDSDLRGMHDRATGTAVILA